MEYKIVSSDNIEELASAMSKSYSEPPWHETWTIEKAKEITGAILGFTDPYEDEDFSNDSVSVLYKRL